MVETIMMEVPHWTLGQQTPPGWMTSRERLLQAGS
jgi:hypothetical protein